MECGFVPGASLGVKLIAHRLNGLPHFFAFFLSRQNSLLVHCPKSDLKCIEKLPRVHPLNTHLLGLDLAATVDTARRARHELHVLVVTPLRL